MQGLYRENSKMRFLWHRDKGKFRNPGTLNSNHVSIATFFHVSYISRRYRHVFFVSDLLALNFEFIDAKTLAINNMYVFKMVS